MKNTMHKMLFVVCGMFLSQIMYAAEETKDQTICNENFAVDYGAYEVEQDAYQCIESEQTVTYPGFKMTVLSDDLVTYDDDLDTQEQKAKAKPVKLSKRQLYHFRKIFHEKEDDFQNDVVKHLEQIIPKFLDDIEKHREKKILRSLERIQRKQKAIADKYTSMKKEGKRVSQNLMSVWKDFVRVEDDLYEQDCQTSGKEVVNNAVDGVVQEYNRGKLGSWCLLYAYSMPSVSFDEYLKLQPLPVLHKYHVHAVRKFFHDEFVYGSHCIEKRIRRFELVLHEGYTAFEKMGSETLEQYYNRLKLAMKYELEKQWPNRVYATWKYRLLCWQVGLSRCKERHAERDYGELEACLAKYADQ